MQFERPRRDFCPHFLGRQIQLVVCNVEGNILPAGIGDRRQLPELHRFFIWRKTHRTERTGQNITAISLNDLLERQRILAGCLRRRRDLDHGHDGHLRRRGDETQGQFPVFKFCIRHEVLNTRRDENRLVDIRWQ